MHHRSDRDSGLHCNRCHGTRKRLKLWCMFWMEEAAGMQDIYDLFKQQLDVYPKDSFRSEIRSKIGARASKLNGMVEFSDKAGFSTCRILRNAFWSGAAIVTWLFWAQIAAGQMPLSYSGIWLLVINMLWYTCDFIISRACKWLGRIPHREPSAV